MSEFSDESESREVREENLVCEPSGSEYAHISDGLVYIESCVPGPGIDEDAFYSQPEGCKCISLCSIRAGSECICLLNSARASGIQDWVEAELLFPAYECSEECSCNPTCPNRLTERGPRAGLKIVDFGPKGFGVMTLEPIRRGDFVCEYAGEIIGEKEARMRLDALRPGAPNYILILREHVTQSESSVSPSSQRLTRTTTVDPTFLGNIGRYLNHSCEPNLCVVPLRSRSLVPVPAIFALKDIKTGEELCYDYDSSVHPVDSQGSPVPLSPSTTDRSSIPCLCFGHKCRKFLPSNPHFI